MKDIEFIGNALDCLKQFPRLARREAGFQLDRVQRGLEPFDWKPMTSIGAGVREIRTWDESGTYRVRTLRSSMTRCTSCIAFTRRRRQLRNGTSAWQSDVIGNC